MVYSELFKKYPKRDHGKSPSLCPRLVDPNRKFWFSTSILIFDQNFDFGPKFGFSIKISIFDPYPRKNMGLGPDRTRVPDNWISVRVKNISEA